MVRGWVSLPVGVVTLAERHGGVRVDRALFEAMVAEVAVHLACGLAQVTIVEWMPWLTPADTPAMKSSAELEILSATVFAWLLKLNVLNSKGEPRKLLSEHRQLKLAQLSYESALGMTPLSRATLKLNTTRAAFDLPAEMIANVNEVGENRRRERQAKAQTDGADTDDDSTN